jgi:hypothetical protein
MTAYIRNTLTYVWLFLSIATVIGWQLGSTNDANSYQASGLITIFVLLLAIIKCRFVIRNFMEVRFAPSWLQMTCDAWLVVLFGIISTFYWLSS